MVEPVPEKRINLADSCIDRDDVFDAVQSNLVGKMIAITNSYDSLEQKQIDEDAKLKSVDRVYSEIKKYKSKLAECVNREIV